MNYPSRTAIIQSVKYAALIKDPFFADCELTTTGTGKPQNWSGGFSMVFQMLKAGELWAFKVWHTDLPDNKRRYNTISGYLAKLKLQYFTDSVYVDNGLLVEGQFLSTYRMKWVNGAPLKDYIHNHINNPVTILGLASSFLIMVTDFHYHKIAHGDLQHGNIIVSNDGALKLIDYDSMYVEGLEDLPDLIKGQAGYQHPNRYFNNLISEKLDYFSELVIYTSLIVYADHPEFWNRDTEWLLFSKEDLESPELSNIFNTLKASNNPKVAILINALHDFLRCEDISQLIPLEYLVNTKIAIKLPSITSITDKFDK